MCESQENPTLRLARAVEMLARSADKIQRRMKHEQFFRSRFGDVSGTFADETGTFADTSSTFADRGVPGENLIINERRVVQLMRMLDRCEQATDTRQWLLRIDVLRTIKNWLAQLPSTELRERKLAKELQEILWEDGADTHHDSGTLSAVANLAIKYGFGPPEENPEDEKCANCSTLRRAHSRTGVCPLPYSDGVEVTFFKKKST